MLYSDACENAPAARVLLVDADTTLKRRIVQAFGRLSLSALIDVATSKSAASALLNNATYDAVIVSLDMEAHIIGHLRSGFKGVLLALSGNGAVGGMVDAIRQGADDVIVKPFNPEALVRRLHGRLALPQTCNAAQVSETGSEKRFGAAFEGFIGQCGVMQDIYTQISRIAPSKAAVFVTGESGTGKEVCADAVHLRSLRKGKCVALNCGAIARDLIESEIFGHIRGAFTGAVEDRAGAAEQADGGTLFLDEICEMDMGLQAKLLRFIQSGEIRRLGDTRPRRVDVRFVCATNRNPQAEVAAGRFREDLFYRLHVLPVHLPPLRQRGDDIIELALNFLIRFSREEQRSFAGFDSFSEKILTTYAWPGNVRQLQNVIRRIVVLNDGARVTADMLPKELTRQVLSGPASADKAIIASPPLESGITLMPLWKHEQSIIEQTLAMVGGNTARAAAVLQISPSTIYRKRMEWSAHADAPYASSRSC
jgi:two-component system repressor protein LuxO